MRAWLIPLSFFILMMIWGGITIVFAPLVMGWISKRLFGAEIDYTYKPPPRKWWQPDTSLNLHLKDDQSVLFWKSWSLTFISVFLLLLWSAGYVFGFALNAITWIADNL